MSLPGMFGRIVGIAVALAIATSWASADEWCDGELEGLKTAAASFEISAQSAPVIAAGETIEVSWNGRIDHFPTYFSAWLVVVSIDDVRFEGTGFYPLPGGTPGPLGMEFARKWTRAIVPLHTPDTPGSGTIRIKPYREGRFGLSWAIIAKSECGERQLTKTGAHVVEVEARQAEIVVQDLYDYTRPEAVIHSLGGRYELRVFDGYYQVFDQRTGGKVADRRGYCPDFSPTGRFVAALAGRSEGQCEFYTAGENKPKFEVVDLLTGKVVANPDPPALWANGDTLLVVPSKWWKMLQGPGRVLSLLTDPEKGGDAGNPPLVEFDDSSTVSIDIANGYVHRLFKSSEGEPEAVFSLGGLGQISEHQIAWDQEKNAAITSGLPVADIMTNVAERSVAATRPTSLAEDDQVRISHQRYLTDPAEVFSDAVDKEEITALAGRSAIHPVVAREEKTAAAGDPFLTAALLRGVNVLASAKQAGRTIEGLVGEELNTAFIPQLDVPNPVERVTGKMWEIDKLDVPDEEKRKRLNDFRAKTVIPEIDRLVNEIDGAFDVLTLRIGCWPSGGALYADNLSGIWRHEGAKRTVWLTHAGCMGIGTVGNLALNHIDLFVKDAGGTKRYNLMFDRRFYCAGNGVECDYVQQNDTGEEYTKTEQGLGALKPAGNMEPDLFGAKIPQDFQQLIEFDSLLPAFLDDRYLLLPVGKRMFVVDLDQETMTGPVQLTEHAAGSRFSISRDRRHLLQTTGDGAIAIHDFASSDVVLNGRYVDDELVIYDRYGRYVSTYEGAQYVHMRFVGRPELYSLSRMAGSLNRPEMVRAALREAGPAERPVLAAPPLLSARIADGGSAGEIEVSVKTSAQSGLTAVRLYADGALVRTMDLDGEEEWEGTLAIGQLPETDWLSLVAVDANGFESATREIRLPERQAERGKLFVIAVGTDIYADSDRLSRLDFAVSDARNFAESIRNSGSRRYDAIEIIGPFLDSETLESDIGAALDEIRADSSPGDTAMIFIAGHGIRADDGQFYLATRNTRLDDLSASGLSWHRFAEALAGLSPRTFVFLDACHSGSVGEATNDGAADALLSAADGSITVIAASKGRQFSLESPTAGGGYFTSAIASIFGNRTDPRFDIDESGTLDLDELYLALKRQVVEATDGRQTPWIARSQVVGKTPLL